MCANILATPTYPLLHNIIIVFSFFSVLVFARCSKINVMADDQEAICNYNFVNGLNPGVIS